MFITKSNAAPIGLEPDQPLAVGSPYKLAVLNALREAVAQGAITWDQVVLLPKGFTPGSVICRTGLRAAPEPCRTWLP